MTEAIREQKMKVKQKKGKENEERQGKSLENKNEAAIKASINDILKQFHN